MGRLFPGASAAVSSSSPLPLGQAMPSGLQARCQSRREPPGSVPRRRRGENGRLPKAKAGRGYRRREADAGAKTTDVCFETRLFRCNLSLENNRREHTHDPPAGLWGDGGSGLICGFHHRGRPEAWLDRLCSLLSIRGSRSRRERRKEGREGEGEPQEGHISLCT